MKKGVTLIELIVMIVIMGMLATVGTIKITNNQNNKAVQQEVIEVYNTFNNHNQNITKGKVGVVPRNITSFNNSGSIYIQKSGSTNITTKIITGDILSFSLDNNTTLGKTISGNSTLRIFNKNGTEEYAEIHFSASKNSVSLIWTGNFSKYN